jgi:sugar (pentulose or hexulose) kinase
MQTAILSLDIGTTIAKAVLFNLKGQELAIAEQGLSLLTPQAGWVELNPAEMWDAVLTIIREICQNLPTDIQITGVGLSSQGGSLLPVDSDGNPTYNLITWLDHRAENLITSWRETGLDQRIREISGWAPQPGLPLSVICDLRQSKPDVFANTDKFLSVHDFIVHQLTGDYVTNPSMAGEMLLTDICTGQWASALYDLAEIQIDQLSPIMPSETIIGAISTEICRQTGLPQGVSLINGGQDHACEALAVGIINPKSLLLACGTAWVINMVTTSPQVDDLPPEMALNYHVVPDRYIASQFLGGLGAGMEWWLDQFWQAPHKDQWLSRSERYASFNKALMGTEPGCNGIQFQPVSGTPRTNWSAGGYSGLRLNHTRVEMGRAVLESAAFELRWALENMQGFGLAGNDVWMVGGATRNSIWPQILVDVTGISISITQYRHGPALGAAILAAKSLGLLTDFPHWITPHKVKPNPGNGAIYDQAYLNYR